MTRRFLPLILALPIAVAVISGPASAMSRRDIDDRDRVVLHGNVRPEALRAVAVGPTDRDLPMERMILALSLRPGARAELDRLLEAQQDPTSPSFHQWLTPEEFGRRFGPSDEDLNALVEWLEDHGFTVEEVAAGRTSLNFTGRVADVERAFDTRITDLEIEGRLHHANSVDPSIPRALSSVVRGVVSLHNIPRKAMNTGIRRAEPEGIGPDYTSGTSHYLSPGDFAIIYDVNALYSAGIDGTGQTIAIVGRTHPSATNWATFRSTMALPSNPPQVVVNGTDPGDQGAGEDGEADLDVEWSGAVAKNATVKFVISKSTTSTDGVDLSAQYIVNNNLAPVMSTSFGQCESSMGSTENAFYNTLWSQAASQGITSFVSSGDSGAAGCNGGSDSSGSGKAVSGLASTPYNVAVGGTQFNEGSGSYWNTTNATGDISAKSYIPEVAWNESANVSGGSGLWATGGGVSTTYAKPSWQVCTGVPADGKRDVPDVSLSAAGHDGYLVYTQGALSAIGGTSASSPAFAGLMALVVQKTGARQGNANTRFYQLANAQYASGGTVVFHDITSGNNSVPGVTGYNCGTGYDAATGLGSVDAAAMVNNWGGTATTYSISGTVTLSGSGLSGVTVTAGSGSATTNASGAFTISGLAAGTYTVTPSKSGYTFSPTSTSSTITSANVTGVNFTATAVTTTYSISGSAGTSGATVTAGTASATSDASNNFTIASLAAGTYTVTPSKTGCTFSPASQSVTITSANVTGINFTASCTSGDLQLTSGVAVTGQSVAKSAWKYYYIVVPSGATNLTLATTSATGDVDIYTQVNAKPTSSSYACRPYTSSGNESCSTTNPAAATWWLGVYGYAAGSYTVTGTYTLGGTTYTVSGNAGTSGATVTAGSASATSDASSNFTLSGLANGTYTVTPTKTGCTFSPTSRSVTVSSANVTGVTFTASCGGATTLFTDGFEGTGWSTAQVSGTAGAWTLVASSTSPTTSPHGGSKLAKFNSYTSASGSQTRLYQSSGFAVGSSYTSVTLKFWMYHDTGYSTYNDRVQVQVSTNGTTWTNVGSAISRYSSTAGWAQATIDLSAYKGTTVYLGFVGISAYGNNMTLDDVTVTAQ